MAKGKSGGKKWWYDFGAMALVCLFFLSLNFLLSGSITWAQYPVLAVLVFFGGFKLLDKWGRK